MSGRNETCVAKMNRTARIVLQIIGAVAILCAAAGVAYTIASLDRMFSGRFTADDETPFLHPACYLMTAVCVGCYALLVVFGGLLLCGRVAHVDRFIKLLQFEIVYFFAVGASWLLPFIGPSIAGATGIANGGLALQFILLFPLWALLFAVWARRKLHDESTVAI